MNKHLFFSLLAMIFCGLATAQAPQLAWVRPIFGTSPTAPLASLVTDMCTDRDGNTYITGEFQTQLKFGNVILNGNNDDKTLFLAKYNNAGTPVWAKKAAPQTPFVSSPFAGSAKIAVDSTGNIYWCGNYIAGALDFGGGVSVTRACTNDCQEGFLVKINGSTIPDLGGV